MLLDVGYLLDHLTLIVLATITLIIVKLMAGGL